MARQCLSIVEGKTVKSEMKVKLPEAGKVAPVEFPLSGGGGAGRFGRVRVCGAVAAARKEQKEEQESRERREDEGQKEIKMNIREERRLPTCCSHRLLVLVFITFIEVVQVPDVCGFDTHQASKALHVFIAEEKEEHLSHRYQKAVSCR